MNTYDMDIQDAASDALVTVDIRTLNRPQLEALRTEAAAAGDLDAVKACCIVLSGLTEADVQAMYDSEDPDMPRLFDSLPEVRAYVVDSLMAGDVVEDPEVEFDVDAIVEASTLSGTIGGRDVYWFALNDDNYWTAVQRNAR